MSLNPIESKYSVGCHHLDVEHARILALCAELGSDKVVCRAEIFNDLVEQAHRHFKGEESLLEARNYPHLEEHTRKHEIYEEVMATILYEACNAPYILKDMAPFLLYWWQEHLQEDDQHYAPWISRKIAA